MAEREITNAVLAAIEAGVIRPALFAELEYVSSGAPAYLRLCTGVGTVEWDGKSWTGGRDLLQITPIRETTNLEAVGFAVRLSGLPADKYSIAVSSMRQGKPGKLWLGFFEPDAYLSLPGTTGNYASTPSAMVNRITSDISLRGDVALNDYTPTNANDIVAKWSGAGGASYILRVPTGGTLRLLLSVDGTTISLASSSVTLASVGITDGSRVGLRADWRQSDGRVQFFYSTDGNLTWTQLGTDQSILIASIFDSVSAPVTVGAIQGGASGFVSGKIYRAQVYNGATLAVDFDARRFSSGQLTAAMTTGETWTISQSGSPAAKIVPQPDRLLADPYPLRRGRFDIAPILREGGTMTIEARYEDRLVDLEKPRERRYTHEDQQLRLAGDAGFDQVPELQDAQDVWGA